MLDCLLKMIKTADDASSAPDSTPDCKLPTLAYFDASLLNDEHPKNVGKFVDQCAHNLESICKKSKQLNAVMVAKYIGDFYGWAESKDQKQVVETRPVDFTNNILKLMRGINEKMKTSDQKPSRESPTQEKGIEIFKAAFDQLEREYIARLEEDLTTQTQTQASLGPAFQPFDSQFRFSFVKVVVDDGEEKS